MNKEETYSDYSHLSKELNKLDKRVDDLLGDYNYLWANIQSAMEILQELSGETYEKMERLNTVKDLNARIVQD